MKRLSTTTQIFIVMDYLIRMSEKKKNRKKKNIWEGHYLTIP